MVSTLYDSVFVGINMPTSQCGICQVAGNDDKLVKESGIMMSHNMNQVQRFLIGEGAGNEY